MQYPRLSNPVPTSTNRVLLAQAKGPDHNKCTKHSDLPSSVTEVMVELEAKAALNAFKPTSVTFLRSVCVWQQLTRSPTRSASHPTPTPYQSAGAA